MRAAAAVRVAVAAVLAAALLALMPQAVQQPGDGVRGSVVLAPPARKGDRLGVPAAGAFVTIGAMANSTTILTRIPVSRVASR